MQKIDYYPVRCGTGRVYGKELVGWLPERAGDIRHYFTLNFLKMKRSYSEVQACDIPHLSDDDDETVGILK